MSSTTPKVWRLGISNAADIPDFQKQIKKAEGKEPIYDAHIHVTSADTIHNLVDFLCENHVKARREYDWGIDEHLWKLKIVAPSESLKENGIEFLERMLDDDEDNDEPSSSSFREIATSSDEWYDFEHWTAARVLTSAKMGALESLQVGSKLHLIYDFGTTTDLFLHVLEEKQNTNNVKLGMVAASIQSTADDVADLQAVPAYSLPPKRQVDASYPQTCKAMIKSQRVQFMILPIIPSSMIVEHILPMCPDRKSFNNLCTASKEIYNTSKELITNGKITPPWWPYKSIEVGADLNMRNMSFSPDGLFLACAGDQQHEDAGILYVWDRRRDGECTRLEGHMRISGLAFSPDGTILASSGIFSGTIRLWRVADWSCTAVLESPGAIRSIAFSPD